MTAVVQASASGTYRVEPFALSRIESLRPLWAAQSGEGSVANRERLFRWLTEGNPHRRGEAPYWLLLDGDRVIGMHGHMPVDAFVAGTRRRLYIAHDDLLAPECRGKGLGKVMLAGTRAQQPAFSIALWHNEANRRLYAKAGWLEPTPPLTSWVLVLDPHRYLSSRLPAPIARLLSALSTPLLSLNRKARGQRPSAGIRLTKIARFDARFDAFAELTAPAFGLLVARDAAYLNWRFIDKPGACYQCVAAEDGDGNLLGWVVHGSRGTATERTGYLFDWLALPERSDIFAALATNAVGQLAAEGAKVISVLGSPGFVIPSLRRLGFLSTRKKLGFMATSPEAGWDHLGVQDRTAWFLTHADGDGDAWNLSNESS